MPLPYQPPVMEPMVVGEPRVAQPVAPAVARCVEVPVLIADEAGHATLHQCTLNLN